MKISDLQGQFTISNLSVTVCDCSVTPSCQRGRVTVTQMGYGAIGIAFASLIVLLVSLLLSVTIFCGKEQRIVQIDSSADTLLRTVDTLLHTNTEIPGTDCMVPTVPLVMPSDQQSTIWSQQYPNPWGMQRTQSTRMVLDKNFRFNGSRGYRQEQLQLFNENSLYKGIFQMRNSSNTERNSTNVTFRSLLHQRLCSIQASEEELGHYDPHPYADEGDSDTQFQLDAISIHDDSLDCGDLQDLSPKFNHLAALCFPDYDKH